MVTLQDADQFTQRPGRLSWCAANEPTRSLRNLRRDWDPCPWFNLSALSKVFCKLAVTQLLHESVLERQSKLAEWDLVPHYASSLQPQFNRNCTNCLLVTRAQGPKTSTCRVLPQL